MRLRDTPCKLMAAALWWAKMRLVIKRHSSGSACAGGMHSMHSMGTVGCSPSLPP